MAVECSDAVELDDLKNLFSCSDWILAKDTTTAKKSSVPQCTVCGNQGAKPHYGSLVCNGCRSFFRRTFRLNLKWTCISNGTCCINSRETRFACKKCRFDKCLSAGMQEKAIQYSRDTIYKRQKPVSNKSDGNDSNSTSAGSSGAVEDRLNLVPRGPQVLPSLISSENTEKMLQMALSFEADIRRRFCVALQRYREQSPQDFQPQTSLARIGVRHSEQLLTLQSYEVVFAAKQLETFAALKLTDQMSLLRSFVGASVTFDMARRSKPFQDILLFPDEQHVMSRLQIQQILMTNVLRRILHELMPLFRHLDPDEIEFALLKFISFWNPDVCSGSSRELVSEQRLMCLCAIEHYVSTKPLSYGGRHGQLLMLTALLERVVADLPKDLRPAYPNPDPLVRELFLTEI